MRGKIQVLSKDHKMQKLLEKEQQLEAELQKCQDNMDLFEEYYLQNSWRTGNIFLGWPMCGYSEISEFINRPRAKKNTKPYVEIADHEKIFSLSSVSSRPFINVSKVSYLATKDLQLETRQKISRSGLFHNKKSRAHTEKILKIEKESNQFVKNEFRSKEQEDDERSESQELQKVINCESKSEQNEESGSDSSSEIQDSRDLKEEESEEEESQVQSKIQESNEQSNLSKGRPQSRNAFNRGQKENISNTPHEMEKALNQTTLTKRQLTFDYKNEKRTIRLQNSERFF